MQLVQDAYQFHVVYIVVFFIIFETQMIRTSKSCIVICISKTCMWTKSSCVANGLNYSINNKERYPKPNGMVDNVIPRCENLSLLDGKTSMMVTCLLCSPMNKKLKLKLKKKERKRYLNARKPFSH